MMRMDTLTFRFLDEGCTLCVGEESRSAMRVLTARLRSLRRVPGVDIVFRGYH